MMYNIDYIPTSKIATLKTVWQILETGPEMTYFQTYDWNASIIPNLPAVCSRFESRYAVLYRDGSAVVIAPIWVIKHTFNLINKKGCYLLGHGGWSHYLNFVYNDTTENEIKLLIDGIAKHYGVSYFGFDDVPEGTLLHKVIAQHYPLDTDDVARCVELQLSELNADYIRHMDSPLDADVIFNLEDTDVDKELCKQLYEAGHPKKVEKMPLFQRMKRYIVYTLHFFFRFELPFSTDTSSCIMTAYIDGKLTAFINYGVDRFKKKMVVLAAASMDPNIGVALMDAYIRRQLEKREILAIDFARGNEMYFDKAQQPYKYTSGGKEQHIHHLIFKV